MIFQETAIPGAYTIDPEKKSDERGFFARTWCADEFREHGLTPELSQCSISYNEIAGTLRGMHFQAAPHEEVKIVRCTAGAMFDVLLDLRESSPAYKKWAGVELTSSNRRAVYIPAGVAHGFITVADGTEVLYMMDRPQAAGSARGFRYDDPAFGIDWPVPVSRVSQRDLAWPAFA